MTNRLERQIFLDFLREGGLRVTAERLALFDEVFEQHGHVDAERILRAMKSKGMKISRATVYRNLELLVSCGLVKKYRLGHDRYLFEHLHPGQQHDHLVCEGCGRVVEFISPGIRALQREICKAHDFDPDQHTLKISGRCLICAGGRRAGRADVAAAAGAPSA